MKARKILITAEAYDTPTVRLIRKYHDEEKSLEEIMKLTGLKRLSVNGYLPYSKVIYKNEEKM